MKFGFRLIICASLLLFFPLYLLINHIQDICNQYRAGAYLVDWFNSKKPGHDGLSVPHIGVQGDKVIVMARLEEEHTEWVEEELPDWQRALYVVNPSEKSLADDSILKTPYNKGHEGMAYLTYVIDFYDKLPSTIAFLHSHRSGFLMAWHTDAPLHDNVLAMQSLQLDFVQKNGYVNLRCNWNPGCKALHRKNSHVTDEVWMQMFAGTSTPPLNTSDPNAMSDVSAHAQKYLPMPERVGTACCAQFAVSRDQVRQRPRDDYIKFRQWIIDTDKNDASSGRVMEFLWHVIFGKESVYCPDEQVCYCQVYGQC